ncbi:MAG: YegS/Rv2252/BmrU family lipid kinase [Desulfobacterales bacterium]|jgi:lipid kinase YegS
MKKTGKFHIIFDQRAHNEKDLQEGVEKMQRLGHSVFTKQIEEPDDAVRYAGEAAAQGSNTVVAVGGDGMLSLVVTGILQKRSKAPCEIGLIPFGTANDFAGACGIPSDDFPAALDIILQTEPVPVDVGQVNGTFFINAVVGGFPAEAVKDTSRKTKALLGKFAYLATGLANIGNLAPKNVRFSAPGFEWEGPVYAFGLGNSRQAGGGIQFSPKAVVNDRLLDLMIMPESEEGLVSLVSDFSRLSRLDETDRIIYRRVPGLDVASHETLHINLDGEPAQGKDFHFRVYKYRLPFHLPKDSPVLGPPSTGDG